MSQLKFLLVRNRCRDAEVLLGVGVCFMRRSIVQNGKFLCFRPYELTIVPPLAPLLLLHRHHAEQSILCGVLIRLAYTEETPAKVVGVTLQERGHVFVRAGVPAAQHQTNAVVVESLHMQLGVVNGATDGADVHDISSVQKILIHVRRRVCAAETSSARVSEDHGIMAKIGRIE